MTDTVMATVGGLGVLALLLGLGLIEHQLTRIANALERKPAEREETRK